MKKVLCLVISVLLITFASYAQKPDSSKNTKTKSKIENDSSSKKKGAITPENMKYLELNKDQEKQITDMHAKHKQEKKKIKDDTSLTEEQKKEKLKTLDKDYKSKSEAVLNPDQKKKYEQKKKEMKETKEKTDNK